MADVKIAIIVASLGRPQNLEALLERLSNQTHLPTQVLLSIESKADAPTEANHPFDVEYIYGPRGMCMQRNRALDALRSEIDLVIFYDDDFVPSKFSLAGLAAFFEHNPTIAGADGLVIQDGILGAGISPEDAARIVDTADEKGPPDANRILAPKESLYGCNMAYRASKIANVRFDEELPLYAWLEDIDFAARVDGPLVKTDAFQGVHCGEKNGREKAGKRLGYSQIANPVYMVRKGTLPFRIAARQISKNFAANHAKAFRSEPWVDRRGRVMGNWIAIYDLLRNRSHPTRILDF